jgi:hypothetical protein
MKRTCCIRIVEFYKDYEKTSKINVFIDEEKFTEQIKDIVNSYSTLKRFTNNDYVGILFVKADVFDDDLNELFSLMGEKYEKINA